MKWISWSGLVGVALLLVGSGVVAHQRERGSVDVDCGGPLIAAQWTVPGGGDSAYASVEGYTQRYQAYRQISQCGLFDGVTQAEVEQTIGAASKPLEALDDGATQATYVIGKEWDRDYKVMLIDYAPNGVVTSVHEALA